MATLFASVFPNFGVILLRLQGFKGGAGCKCKFNETLVDRENNKISLKVNKKQNKTKNYNSIYTLQSS